MNREIIFRGKRCSDDKWVYGFYVESKYSWKGHKPHKSWIVSNAISNGGFFNILGRSAVKDNTIGQFTGLYDKNGKEIYEGDIIKVIDCAKVVKYINEICSFCFGNIETLKEPVFAKWGDLYNYHQINGTYLEEYKNEIEVIGNVHDNPELLK